MRKSAKKPGGWLRLFLVGGFAALVPKCFACIAGYFALITGFGMAAPELCGSGAGEGTGLDWRVGVAIAAILAWLGH